MQTQGLQLPHPCLPGWQLGIIQLLQSVRWEFSDAGLPLSLFGGYVQSKGFYFSTISLLFTSATSVLLLSLLMVSILASPGARLHSLNMYVVFLAIPDWFLNIYFLITRSLILADKTIEGHFFPEYEGHFFPEYDAEINALNGFWNICINVIIGYEIKKIVLRSHQRIGTNPPIIKRVLVQCLTLYILLILLVLGFTYWRWTINITLYWLFLFPFSSFTYLLHALWRIRKTGILSLTGRTRSLTIYFYQILIV